MGYTVNLLFVAILRAGWALGYTVASGLAVPAQPSCSLYTVYFSNMIDLASASSSLFSTIQLCTASTTASSTSTFDAAASSTASAPAGFDFLNPGFEDTATASDVAFQWNVTSNNPNSVSVFDASSTYSPYSGTRSVGMGYGFAGLETQIDMSQAVTHPAGIATISMWTRIANPQLPYNCDLRGVSSSGSSVNFEDVLTPGAVLGTSWRQYKASGMDVDADRRLHIVLSNCAHTTAILLDEIHFAIT